MCTCRMRCMRLEELGFDSALLAGLSYGERMVTEAGREAVLNVLEQLSEHDAGVRRRLASMKNIYPKHEEFTAKINQLDTDRLSESAQTTELHGTNESLPVLGKPISLAK